MEKRSQNTNGKRKPRPAASISSSFSQMAKKIEADQDHLFSSRTKKPYVEQVKQNVSLCLLRQVCRFPPFKQIWISIRHPASE